MGFNARADKKEKSEAAVKKLAAAAAKKKADAAAAKTKAKGEKPLVQTKLHVDKFNKDIEIVAVPYYQLVLERLEIQGKEGEAKELLLAAMKKARKKNYVTNKIEVHITDVEKLTVHRPKED